MEKKLTVIPPSQTNGNAKSANSSQCRVAAYCRVSTEQEEQLGSFANQFADTDTCSHPSSRSLHKALQVPQSGSFIQAL